MTARWVGFLFEIAPILILILGGMKLALLSTMKKWVSLSPLVFFLSVALSGFVSAGMVYDWFPLVQTGSERWYLDFKLHFLSDSFSYGWFILVSVFLGLSLLLVRRDLGGSDVYSDNLSLLLFAGAGIEILLSASSLLMVFLGLEFMSLPVYALVGCRRLDASSCEAALKYFLFGSLASVLLLLGMAVIYGCTGSIYFSEIERMIHGMEAGGAALGIGLFIVVVLFKLGVAPFHLWLPDTYEGAPTPITAFMGSAIKAAGVGLALRLFWGPLLPKANLWVPVLIALAILAMVVGSLGGLKQKGLKRLLAYSSIAHAGYLVLGVASIPKSLESMALWFYVLTYGLMFVGMMAAVLVVEKDSGRTTIQSLSGIGFKRPWYSACIVIFMLSAAGIPPLAGFTAKYWLFLQVVESGHVVAAICAVVSSLVSVYYYLRIIIVMYMTESERAEAPAVFNRLFFGTAALCAALLVYLGILPRGLI